jgi:hypothetical protein
VQNQLIEFPEDYTEDQKLDLLFKYHRFDRHVDIDEQDKNMIIMALNQNDVESIDIDDEGWLVIGYSGDEWSKEYEQRAI